MKNYKQLAFFTLLIIFSCQKNKQQTDAPVEAAFDQAAEKKAIMAVIDRETDCFFKGDYNCWAAGWSHQPYAMQAWNNTDGSFSAAVGWEKINAQGKAWIDDVYKNGKIVHHPKFKRDTIQFKFFDHKTAYLIWKQINADEKGPKAQVSQETRLMEKEADGWKIVNVSAFWDSKNRVNYE